VESSARHPANVASAVVVAACAASAGAHAALVPAHLGHEPALGLAFVAAAVVTLAVSAVLTFRPDSAAAGHLAALVLAALIAAYAVSVTTGIPALADEPEPVDLVGLATKAVEALGLVFALQIHPTMGGRGSLTQKEPRQ
jgi:hypothetical protein